MKPEAYPTLDQIWQESWQQLADAMATRSPFLLPVLSTSHLEGPQGRIIVLRRVEPEAQVIYAYSDFRAQKVRELTLHTQASWLFWNPESQTQLRITGETEVYNRDEVARAHWEKVDLSHRKHYSAQLIPGTEIESPSLGVEAFYRGQSPSEADQAQWFEHFSVIRTEVSALDWVQLSAEGHLRASFTKAEGAWQAKWLVP